VRSTSSGATEMTTPSSAQANNTTRAAGTTASRAWGRH
jgi:hypothetical protein